VCSSQCRVVCRQGVSGLHDHRPMREGTQRAEKAWAERRDLPPTLLQVFVEKREDAVPCVIGAGLVVAESDDA
jgi:hypothetical protein